MSFEKFNCMFIYLGKIMIISFNSHIAKGYVKAPDTGKQG
jgi:hypothetical protein